MRRSRVLLVGLLSIGAAGPPAAAASPPAPGTTTLVSVATNGREANGWSWGAAISANGRFVAFWSTASNLLADGPKSDLFIRDLRLGVTRPLAVAGDGGPTDNASYDPTLSRSGRYVAFESVASNLVPGDTNNDWDVFVRDMRRGVVWRVNVAADGSQAEGFSGPSAISPDGHAVTFTSTASNLVAGGANHHWDVFARDLRTGVLSAVSVADDGTWGNADSISSAISRHGRRVTFSSSASNLVAGDTNGRPDVFVRDLRTHRTQLVSVAADGGPGSGWSDGGSMNADGRYVAFTSAASNLVDGDTNGTFDVFVRDLRTRRTRLVDITAEGTQFASGASNVTLSANGGAVAFLTDETRDMGGWFLHREVVYVRDLHRRTQLATVATDGGLPDNDSFMTQWALSGDGRRVAFDSFATNLVEGFHLDPFIANIFVRTLPAH